MKHLRGLWSCLRDGQRGYWWAFCQGCGGAWGDMSLAVMPRARLLCPCCTRQDDKA